MLIINILIKKIKIFYPDKLVKLYFLQLPFTSTFVVLII
jgi:hypothetical protein